MRLPFPITHTQDPRTDLQPPQRFQEKPREAHRERGPTVRDPPRSGGWKILDATTQKSGDLGASQIPWAARDAGQTLKWTLDHLKNRDCLETVTRKLLTTPSYLRRRPVSPAAPMLPVRLTVLPVFIPLDSLVERGWRTLSTWGNTVVFFVWLFLR